MPKISELIHELTVATGQMKQAALTNDWEMAEKIQKRRARLLEQITAVNTLDLAENLELRAVREQESVIIARANARHQALGLALAADAQAPSHPKKPSRMRKAYGCDN